MSCNSTHRCSKDVADGLVFVPHFDVLGELDLEHVVALQYIPHLVEDEADGGLAHDMRLRF